MIQAGFDRNDLAVQEDFDFHLAICKAAKNKYLLSVLEFSRENILKGMRFARELTTDRFSPRSLLAQKEHGAILAAIEDGDEAAARQQMCKHIFNTRNRIFTGTDGDA
jgi:DNA-binding FadR family transcriptional regulator